DVLFSEQVESTSAQTASNYVISPVLGVKTAVLQPDGRTVRLTTDAQTGGTAYNLTVTGVKDGAGNLVGVNNTTDFAGVSPPVTSPPEVLSATATDNISLEVVFSVTMDPMTVQNPANYTVSPALPVTGAILQKDGVTVKLSTAAQTGGTGYILTVSNVKDQYGNTIGTVNNSVSFIGSSVVSKNPHGRYLSDTNQCSQCHATHSAEGAGLINQQDQTQMCYLCHDAGGQSQYDIAGQFGLEAPYAVSHHKVPEGTMQCSDCHNPHDGGRDVNGNDIHWARLLQSSADSNTHGGNEFCFSCHKDLQGNLKALDPSVYPADGTGHNNSSFVINGTTPFSPDSGTDIRCMGCHQQHGSSLPELLKDKITEGDTPVTGNDKTLCFKCHTNASPDNRFPGKAVADAVFNPHALTSSANTGVSYPGTSGQAGQCANCHDPHGSAYGTSKVSMKTLRGPYNDGKTQYIAPDFTLCFGCHNNTSTNTKYDIQTPYNSSQGGHYIKSSGGNLIPGSKMPCEACHSLHGSANNNKYMLKDSLGSNLGDGRNECLTCHQTGKVVEGITMSPPTAVVPEHAGTAACLSCHGSAHAPVN
ncbi:MAG TPA: cytochrome c3 family protein, partial [Desulfobacteria bacterium]|nr:cytochrome c3 family protein [Desulfobacteria bacterium]